jgi:TPR repeat protein
MDVSDTDTGRLLKRAEALINEGNLHSARVLLERASNLGSGEAALTVARTYDPAHAAQFGKLGALSDPHLARIWYERALTLGSTQARERLAELAKQ